MFKIDPKQHVMMIANELEQHRFFDVSISDEDGVTHSATKRDKTIHPYGNPREGAHIEAFLTPPEVKLQNFKSYGVARIEMVGKFDETPRLKFGIGPELIEIVLDRQQARILLAMMLHNWGDELPDELRSCVS